MRITTEKNELLYNKKFIIILFYFINNIRAAKNGKEIG